MEAGANKLRANHTTWKTMMLCSSNASFYDKMSSSDKKNADAEMMRLIEFQIDKPTVLDPVYAKQMFDHQLNDNFGHAGEIYIKYVLQNYEEVKRLFQEVQAKFDQDLEVTQRERIWSAVYAALITAGFIATKKCDLMDWKMKPIYEEAKAIMEDARGTVPVPTLNPVSVLGGYMNAHHNNLLVINDLVDKRNKDLGLQNAPIKEPTRELLMRYEPDTGRLYVTASHFKQYCTTYQLSYSDLRREFKRMGVLKGSISKRMGKGTSFPSPNVSALEFDTNNPDFFEMESVVAMPAMEDADT